MTLTELINQLQELETTNRDSLVAAINTESGEIWFPREVEAEFHEDGDGSTTIWLKSVER